MKTIISHLRRMRQGLAAWLAPSQVPDAYEAFCWDHGQDPLDWPPDERAEYSGYAHAFAFLAAADQRRKTGGLR